MNSMTGYGRGICDEDDISFTIELKSVNNRYLDINIRLPRHINSLEDKIRKYIASKVLRGKIDVFITQEKLEKDSVLISVDKNIADAYYNALGELKNTYNLKDDVTLSLLTKYPEIITVQKKEDDMEKIWGILKKSLDEALTMLIDMRSKEGLKLSKDMSERCDIINNVLINIEKRAPQVVDEYRNKIKERVLQYLNDVELDESRLINEVAFFADKASITEEIVRLKSHIDQFKNSVKDTQAIGRKLDFLIQEMNREVNTIGSKSNDLFITNMVVEIKSELEKIREQVQNIE